jgi:8-oxo-dGTP pyrophosphatase MutT (NUDIX family)
MIDMDEKILKESTEVNRQLYGVTCKVALHDKPRHLILLVEYANHDLGLPGGHLELNENPEGALKRELLEELNINYDQPLVRKDFWLSDSGDKIILGFVGTMDSSKLIKFDKKEIYGIRWVAINDIKNGKVSTRAFDKFIINNVA